MGLPILTSITGSGAKYLEKKNTTFIYKQDDFLSLVKILENLTTNKQKIFQMKASSVSLFNESFSFEKVYGDAYRKIIK